MKTKTFPMNLQFFAEDSQKPEAGKEANTDEPKKTDTSKKNPDNDNPTSSNEGGEEYTVEGLLAQLTKERADKARMKTDYDKLCASEGNLRKQLRAKQTAEEQAAEAEAEAKREQEEHITAVEKELAVMKASNRYLKLGFGEEEAGKMALDEVNGDMDAWTAGVNNFLANAKKDAYAQARADLLKEMPVPQSGNEGEVDYSKMFNDAMDDGDTRAAITALLEQSKANESQV